MRERIARLLRILGLAGIVAFGLASFTPLPNWVHRRMVDIAEVGPADAIVVLGASVYSDGLLNDASLRRSLGGILHMRRGLAPIIVFLGSPKGKAVEALARAEMARELGIPTEAILTDSRALTTQQEAKRVTELLRPRGTKKVLLVTGSYHMMRARRVFEKAGYQVIPAPVDEISACVTLPMERLAMTKKQLITLAARAYYRMTGRI
jgi:uncharacterized SAM-binding protein YcdF (DUF218 family)